MNTDINKQDESLEDAAIRLFPDKSTRGWKDSFYWEYRKKFIKGANYQSEKDKVVIDKLREDNKMLLEALIKIMNSADQHNFIGFFTFDNWCNDIKYAIQKSESK